MHARRLRAAGGCRGFVSWPGRKAPGRAIAFDPIALSRGGMLVGRILAKVFRARRIGEARSGEGNTRCEATKSFAGGPSGPMLLFALASKLPGF
jgi:hypothetical protein